jgi:hypothetical protein
VTSCNVLTETSKNVSEQEKKESQRMLKPFLRILPPGKIQKPLEPQKVLYTSSQKMKQQRAR